ncbi:hypothetical protein [Sphingobacterium sp.]|uniref:hypothetical protein n=1 Tax=Sphingobacterium sp. TaxID=341027 RepID=UPI00289E49EC|nr:hypothetical protein [Sphingobacterium sp.]
MKVSALIVLIIILFSSCKEVEEPAPFVNLVEFKISTDVPIENLTIRDIYRDNPNVFPKQAIKLKNSFVNNSWMTIYQYSETINISENATVELIIPKNSKRKIFSVRFYDKVNIDYFFDEDGLTKKRFSVPENK